MLRELQRRILEGLWSGEGAAAALALLSKGRALTPAEQLAVYRGSVSSTLTAALEEVYPVCRRLVGDRFFGAAAAAFVSGTLLFDLARRDWSEEVLEALEIPRAWLPPTYEGPEVTGKVSAEAAEATGLLPGVPVMAGGGDQAAGAVGTGAVIPGIVNLTLGTSGVVFATTAGPFVEPEGRLHAFCHALPGTWHLIGGDPGGGRGACSGIGTRWRRTTLSKRWSRKPPPRRRGARAWSSCPIFRESARATRIRWPAVPSWGSPPATAART